MLAPFPNTHYHDLAKWLSYYLIFLFFSFITKVEHGKYHMTVTESQRCDISHRMVTSHGVTSHSHSIWQRSQLTSNLETMRDKKHSHNSNCIYSIVNLTGTLSSSLCQMLIKSSWLYSSSGVGSLTLTLINKYFLIFTIMAYIYTQELCGFTKVTTFLSSHKFLLQLIKE